jgi:hypothetical protein
MQHACAAPRDGVKRPSIDMALRMHDLSVAAVESNPAALWWLFQRCYTKCAVFTKVVDVDNDVLSEISAPFTPRGRRIRQPAWLHRALLSFRPHGAPDCPLALRPVHEILDRYYDGDHYVGISQYPAGTIPCTFSLGAPKTYRCTTPWHLERAPCVADPATVVWDSLPRHHNVNQSGSSLGVAACDDGPACDSASSLAISDAVECSAPVDATRVAVAPYAVPSAQPHLLLATGVFTYFSGAGSAVALQMRHLQVAALLRRVGCGIASPHQSPNASKGAQNSVTTAAESGENRVGRVSSDKWQLVVSDPALVFHIVTFLQCQ